MQIPKPKEDNKPWSWFQDGYNPRPVVEDDAFHELVESIRKHGILQPIGALDNGQRIFGNRRFAAGKRAGLELIPVRIYPSTLTESQVGVLTWTENILRVDLSEPEIYRSLCELRKLNPEWDRKVLAALLCKDPSTITRWLSPDDLVEEAKQAFLDGKFGFAKAYSIAKLPKEEQPAQLALTLRGATRDELETAGRRKRLAATPAVRASKIKCPLPSGHVVTVAGDELSLDEAIEVLKEAIKAMTKARDTGMSAMTAQKVWADMAKAG
jgi:ParB family transcriptional regulator, chromosome partitioning protein